MFTRELKKGSTEILVLSLIEHRARHGYEIGKQIETLSGGRLKFRIGSLYPILCRLEDRGLVSGRWIEKAGERRRRYYRLTPAGRRALARERSVWRQFVLTIDSIVGAHHG
ncbi:MAG TPA: PadR family transcriptional regulator [Vicinamibacterales bacterium]|nr:PadR family transcriptional regulator [Vicinamibacterales bacterium]